MKSTSVDIQSEDTKIIGKPSSMWLEASKDILKMSLNATNKLDSNEKKFQSKEIAWEKYALTEQ
jgi:hypothetical protein